MPSDRHDYLRRLDRSHYTGLAIVHWTHTIDGRRTGWLDDSFHTDFREALIHASFRHSLLSPAYCLMPDHLHLVWCGADPASDQRDATAWLRRRVNALLKARGFQLQKQAYDHVLRDSERERFAFERLVGYVLSNPDRAGLVGEGAPPSARKWRDSILPGYPEAGWQKSDPGTYWERFWKLYHASIREAP